MRRLRRLLVRRQHAYVPGSAPDVRWRRWSAKFDYAMLDHKAHRCAFAEIQPRCDRGRDLGERWPVPAGNQYICGPVRGPALAGGGAIEAGVRVHPGLLEHAHNPTMSRLPEAQKQGFLATNVKVPLVYTKRCSDSVNWGALDQLKCKQICRVYSSRAAFQPASKWIFPLGNGGYEFRPKPEEPACCDMQHVSCGPTEQMPR